MYCSLSDQVKSSMLLGQRRRRPVCRMLKVDILGRQDHRDSLSAVDGALRCCGSVAGTVQTSMAVPCRVDTYVFSVRVHVTYIITRHDFNVHTKSINSLQSI